MIHIKNTNIEQDRDTIVTLGNFDGFHLGHLKLIKMMKKYKEKFGLRSVIFSFLPHPKYVLFGEEIKHIFSCEEKKFLIKNTDIDVFIEYPFTKEFALLSPISFVLDILVKKLRCKALVIGEEYRFGNNKEGNIKTLKYICNEFSIELIIVDHILYEGKKISSSNIRQLISKGSFTEANKMLFYVYFIKGMVIRGNQLGRTIGFPTANIMSPINKVLPINGVYITKTLVEKTKKLYNSVTNIGSNPTINDKDMNKKSIETFIFNFNDDIYGTEILVYFYKLLRFEKKFNSLEELKNQISKDVKNTQIFLKNI